MLVFEFWRNFGQKKYSITVESPNQEKAILFWNGCKFEENENGEMAITAPSSPECWISGSQELVDGGSLETDVTVKGAASSSNGAGDKWPYKEVLLLIDTYKRLVVALIDCKDAKRQDFWKQVATQLSEHGYNRTFRECDEKWRSLTRTYRRKEDNRSKNVKPWIYYQRMRGILGNPADPFSGRRKRAKTFAVESDDDDEESPRFARNGSKRRRNRPVERDDHAPKWFVEYARHETQKHDEWKEELRIRFDQLNAIQLERNEIMKELLTVVKRNNLNIVETKDSN